MPGDVLFVRGTGGLTELGTTGGFLGHFLVALALPRRVGDVGEEAAELQAACPSLDLAQVWRVPTVESTRSHAGLHECEMLVRVDARSGRLSLVGELADCGRSLSIVEDEPVEIWQSPAEIRTQLRAEDVAAVLAEMKAAQKDWSLATAARALLRSADLQAGGDRAQLLRELRKCWTAAPICTSVVVVFWQRCLCRLARSAGQREVDLIFKCMPLFADRGLPGDLISAMKRCGWSARDRVTASLSL